jgi:D-alanyl-D-alanine carboxypeptidase
MYSQLRPFVTLAALALLCSSNSFAQPKECPFDPLNPFDPKVYTCKEPDESFWSAAYDYWANTYRFKSSSMTSTCKAMLKPPAGWTDLSEAFTEPVYASLLLPNSVQPANCFFEDSLPTGLVLADYAYSYRLCTAPWQQSTKRLSLGNDPMPLEAFCYLKAVCPVAPLTKLTDPDAIALENGGPPRVDKLTAAFKQNLSCMQAKAAAAGGTLTVTSAWRPQQYQDHFREIFDKWQQFQSSPGLKNRPECKPTYDQIVAEKQKHGLQAMVGKTSRHVAGTAFDAIWSNIPDSTVDQVASQCGISRPWPKKDRPHFQ